MSLKAISLKQKNTIIRCSYMFHYHYSFTHHTHKMIFRVIAMGEKYCGYRVAVKG